ncbi:exosome complex component RRP45 isoform X2 [Varanus komodoensis]|uniref:exosome complex component RRP45 isoform X2 n=1 Tax=Varanus komodoensis TaxID=61221 RepID=UPI001CF793E5|nr:exosome complex component RRP45 isoform X2 [Varanus komodoensis]
MKETPLSNCEKRFLLRAIEEKKRLDGRQCYDYRNLRISFGADYGCCIVELGKTRILGQVSCELVSPKPNRATEGILFFNLELSPMASPAFEPGRQSELLVKLNRLLERCLRNSKCIDTESLCVVAGEKYSPEERDPVPLSIHHMPICVSFAFFQQGTYLLVDPSEQEERVMDGLLVIAMNKHREICTIQSSGGIMLLKDQVLRCSKITGVKVAEITELIQKALENDKNIRKQGGKFGFAESISNQRITAFKLEQAPIDTKDVQEQAEKIIAKAVPPSDVLAKPIVWSSGTAQIGEGLENSWGDFEESEKEEEEDEFAQNEPVTVEDQNMETGDANAGIMVQKDATIVLSDSEEEDIVILEPEVTHKKRTPSSPKPGSTKKKPVGKKKKKRAVL